MRVRRRRWWLPGSAVVVGACALVAASIAVVPVAQGREAANLSLDVTFNANGTIALTLPDGTPVGSTTGTPTVIPAGFYSLLLSGPGGCTDLPYFNLQGPGVNITDNMDEGEMTSTSDGATFQPSSTYTWSDQATPSTVYTFVTSSQVVGTPPPSYTSGAQLSSGSHATASSSDLVGSAAHSSKAGSTHTSSAGGALPFRGKITADLNTAGTLTLAYDGKSVSRLTAGRYTITVTDKSPRSGFVLEDARDVVTIARAGFVGTRTTSVDLTQGRWFIVTGPSGKRSSLVVAG